MRKRTMAWRYIVGVMLLIGIASVAGCGGSDATLEQQIQANVKGVWLYDTSGWGPGMTCATSFSATTTRLALSPAQGEPFCTSEYDWKPDAAPNTVSATDFVMHRTLKAAACGNPAGTVEGFAVLMMSEWKHRFQIFSGARIDWNDPSVPVYAVYLCTRDYTVDGGPCTSPDGGGIFGLAGTPIPGLGIQE